MIATVVVIALAVVSVLSYVALQVMIILDIQKDLHKDLYR